MLVFVYEHITGGGTLADGPETVPAGGLLTEGSAMVRALVADFAAVPGIEVCALRDARLPGFSLQDCHLRSVADAQGHELAFKRLAAQSDATLLVAPEAGGALQNCCRQVVAAGGRLLGPNERAVEMVADKLRLAQCLTEARVPTPATRSVTAGEPLPIDFPYPAMIKPVRGAGSIGVQLVSSPDAWKWPAGSDRHDGWVLQRCISGMPSSVAVLCRPSGRQPLVPCSQRLSGIGQFQYLGGELPLPDHLADRAVCLADAAVAHAMPGVVGYVGVDLVLDDEPAAMGDAVIEINPRVTTSYVGLRVAARENLAAAMLALLEDEPPNVRFSNHPLQFDADGTVRLAGTSRE